MGTGARRIGRSLAVLALVVLAACAAQTRYHGYVPSDEQLDAVVVGRDTRSTVATILGPPGATGVVADTGWYYVRSTYRNFAYNEPEETDRVVVAVSYDEEGVVTNVERFGLEDGQVVALSRRVTESNTQGIGFLRQLFGNLGRFDPGAFFN
jgi:outer membrane protein assembly factor BamE (lipoprotein component of BamABCDE complex)